MVAGRHPVAVRAVEGRSGDVVDDERGRQRTDTALANSTRRRLRGAVFLVACAMNRKRFLCALITGVLIVGACMSSPTQPTRPLTTAQRTAAIPTASPTPTPTPT